MPVTGRQEPTITFLPRDRALSGVFGGGEGARGGKNVTVQGGQLRFGGCASKPLLKTLTPHLVLLRARR